MGAEQALLPGLVCSWAQLAVELQVAHRLSHQQTPHGPAARVGGQDRGSTAPFSAKVLKARLTCAALNCPWERVLSLGKGSVHSSLVRGAAAPQTQLGP